MFYESLIILNISTLNFSEGVPASVLFLLDTVDDGCFFVVANVFI